MQREVSMIVLRTVLSLITLVTLDLLHPLPPTPPQVHPKPLEPRDSSSNLMMNEEPLFLNHPHKKIKKKTKLPYTSTPIILNNVIV